MRELGTITTPLGNELAVLRDDRGRLLTTRHLRDESGAYDLTLPVRREDEGVFYSLLREAAVPPDETAAPPPVSVTMPVDDGRRRCAIPGCGALLSRFNTTAWCALHEGEDLTIEELAALLGVGVRKARSLVRVGRIRRLPTGSRGVRFARSEAARFLAEKGGAS